ncbi:MAG: DUF4177 domain-containing protein [Bilifractor sp.]
MKEYKLVFQNKKWSLSRDKDLAQAQNMINQTADEGWTLQQIISPSDLEGALVGVFFQEKQ